MNVKEYEPVICNDIKCSTHESFGALLNSKEANFNNNFDKTYSTKAIDEYIYKSIDLDEYCLYFIPGNFLLMISGCVLGYFFGPLAFLLFIPATCFHYIVDFGPVKKVIKNRWMKKEKNIKMIRKAMFIETLADKEILKSFIDVYGKEELKKILMKNGNVTYLQIEQYFTSHDEKIKKMKNENDKVRKVDEIVECIATS